MPVTKHFNANPTFETDVDGTVKALKRAVFASTSGDVVPAVTGKKIKVYAYAIQSGGAGAVCQLKDGSGGANLTIGWEFDSREGVAPSTIKPPAYLFSTSPGTSLYAQITGTIRVEVSYWDDDAV